MRLGYHTLLLVQVQQSMRCWQGGTQPAALHALLRMQRDCCLADGGPEELQLAVHRAMRICDMACDSDS